MNKVKILTLFLIIGFLSCKTSNKDIDQLEIAKQYYQFLDDSDDIKIGKILSDSIVIRESEDNYEERFSKKGYMQWLQWDSVFDPTYKVLEIEQQNDIVIAKISKIDQRIAYLHEKPIVWNEIIQFDNHKIKHVERTEYEVFNVTKFLKNRDTLVSWIDENHPELSGFLHDQTMTGGQKYLKAIELYSNKN